MTAILRAILADLAAPGRILAFCDETDLTTEATSTMVANIHFHAAVVLPSYAYRALAPSLTAALKMFGVAEFHANAIVNNGKKSAWRDRDKAERLNALATICDALCASDAHIYYVHIAKRQYDTIVAALPPGSLDASHKIGVKTRFRELIAELLNTSAPAIVVADKEKNNKGFGLAKFSGGHHLLGGGILLAHSHEVLGLQLADAAAYVIGRYLRRRDRMVEAADEQKMEPFDRLAAQTVARLQGRVHSLLSEPSLYCHAA
jgi:hypothetical protein